MSDAPALFLASASARRSELLRQLGVAFGLIHAPIDEAHDGIETPEDYVARLARTKAEAGWQALPAGASIRSGGAATGGVGAVALGADTAVVLNGQILGKPAHRDDGLRMLSRLSGRTHRVLTAVALSNGAGVQTQLSCSQVTFRPIGEAERESYWQTGEPDGKAGGYAIQGFGACFVLDLQGSYSAVMGLPLFETAQLLDTAGVARWRRSGR